MAAPAERFVCQECGASTSKWAGRCDSCGAWNTIVEETPAEAPPRGLSAGKGRAIDLAPLDGAAEGGPREATGIAEFDRVCGGGLVPGSAILIGGDPGIGKSTLVIQVLAALARRDLGCVYVSGEEAVDQVRGRARPAGHRRRPGAAGDGDQRTRYPDHPRRPRRPARLRDRFRSRPSSRTRSPRRRAQWPRCEPAPRR